MDEDGNHRPFLEEEEVEVGQEDVFLKRLKKAHAGQPQVAWSGSRQEGGEQKILWSVESVKAHFVLLQTKINENICRLKWMKAVGIIFEKQ